MLGPRNQTDIRAIADRLDGPFQILVPAEGISIFEMTKAQLGELGFKLLIDAAKPMLVSFRAWKELYEATADDLSSTALTADEARELTDQLNDAVGIDHLLEIERATVELSNS